jgi:hypothetical protein
MGLLDNVLADDRFAFNDTDVFGETATYKPKNGGATRSIKVVVNRNIPVEISPQGVTRYPILVAVTNSATYGISATELDTGADKIAVAFRQGGTAQDFLLGTPEAQDGGMLYFRLFGTSR